MRAKIARYASLQTIPKPANIILANAILATP